jgi:predicted CopG family antitoxin
MTQKTISLPKEVYDKLKAEKRENESFPQLLLRLLEKEKNNTSIEPLIGIFEEESEEWGKIEDMLYEDRLKSKKRVIESNEE